MSAPGSAAAWHVAGAIERAADRSPASAIGPVQARPAVHRARWLRSRQTARGPPHPARSTPPTALPRRPPTWSARVSAQRARQHSSCRVETHRPRRQLWFACRRRDEVGRREPQYAPRAREIAARPAPCRNVLRYRSPPRILVPRSRAAAQMTVCDDPPRRQDRTKLARAAVRARVDASSASTFLRVPIQLDPVRPRIRTRRHCSPRARAPPTGRIRSVG